jgi:phosphate starvation-inducible PhoH-like protein
MIQGENNLSRARGTKAQSRRQQQFLEQQQIENTIDFNQAVRKRKHIELLPKSRAQENLVVSLVDPGNYITVALGPAGTGKSYLAMLAALKDLQQGRCRKIVLTRPAVGVEDEQHGFLPGDLNQKMEPWTRPLLDIMKEFYHPREVVKMIEDGIVEISPLAFMRGRTFRDSWIVADEMQNATPNQMKMLLTRIGENSRIVVTGDIEQTDKKMIDNGLMDLADKLESHPVPGMQICRLGVRDVQRHRVIEQVLKLYN